MHLDSASFFRIQGTSPYMLQNLRIHLHSLQIHDLAQLFRRFLGVDRRNHNYSSCFL